MEKNIALVFLGTKKGFGTFGKKGASGDFFRELKYCKIAFIIYQSTKSFRLGCQKTVFKFNLIHMSKEGSKSEKNLLQNMVSQYKRFRLQLMLKQGVKDLIEKDQIIKQNKIVFDNFVSFFHAKNNTSTCREMTAMISRFYWNSEYRDSLIGYQEEALTYMHRVFYPKGVAGFVDLDTLSQMNFIYIS